MIVGNFDFEGVAAPPNEADSPLIVDANAVLSLPIAAQGFEPIARRGCQIAEVGGSVELPELS
jgi:hypothetical protein